MHNGVTGKGGNGGKSAGKAQHHHDQTSEQDHGKPVPPVLSHIARQHNGFRLEGNRGYRAQGAAGHRAYREAQSRGNGSKAVGQSQQTLGDTVQHNADGSQNVLNDLHNKCTSLQKFDL